MRLRYLHIINILLIVILYFCLIWLIKSKFYVFTSWNEYLSKLSTHLGIFLAPILLILGVILFLIGKERKRVLLFFRNWLALNLYQNKKNVLLVNYLLGGIIIILLTVVILLKNKNSIPNRVFDGQVLVLKKNYYVIDDLILIEPFGKLIIQKGTTIKMKKSGGIVVKGILEALGTKENNINIEPFNDMQHWRNITFWGEKSSGSKLSYVNISFGSGMETANVEGNFVYKENSDIQESKRGGGILIYNSSPTITNSKISNCTARYGGGINIRDNSNPKLTNVWIEKNSVKGSKVTGGGGIWISNANPELFYCKIINNKAESDLVSSGGGIYCGYNSYPNIYKCSIMENTADGDGGGIYCRNTNISNQDKVFLIQDNKINNNLAAQYGGGICLDLGSSPYIINNEIKRNRTTGYIHPINSEMTSSGGGIFIGGDLIKSVKSTPIINNNIIQDNEVKFDSIGGENFLYGTGGGVSCFNDAEIIFEGNKIISNKSGKGGGVYRTLDCRVKSSLNTIYKNNSPDSVDVNQVMLRKNDLEQ